MGKRIVLFLLTNLAIVLMVSIVMSVLGALGVFRVGGGQLGLLAICFVYGMVAAFISLQMSRFIAKRAMGVRLVDGRTGNPDLDWLHNTVGNLARQANLPMPEVGVYESPEVNAFATGPSRKRSLVAVSTGILRAMDRRELEGVLAHEVSHVANGDMVTMALIQGVVNAFVLYLSHVVAGIVRAALSGQRDGDERGGSSILGVMAGYAVFFACQIVFGILGSMVTAWFSRHREFRADAGGAALAGRESMIGALRRLMGTQDAVDTSNPALASFKISGGRGGFLALLATHPPLEARIAALQEVDRH